MPLNKLWLANQLEALEEQNARVQAHTAQARRDRAQALADVIDTYVKGADVTGSVSTTGTATAQQGTITSGRLQ